MRRSNLNCGLYTHAVSHPDASSSRPTHHHSTLSQSSHSPLRNKPIIAQSTPAASSSSWQARPRHSPDPKHPQHGPETCVKAFQNHPETIPTHPREFSRPPTPDHSQRPKESNAVSTFCLTDAHVDVNCSVPVRLTRAQKSLQIDRAIDFAIIYGGFGVQVHASTVRRLVYNQVPPIKFLRASMIPTTIFLGWGRRLYRPIP